MSYSVYTSTSKTYTVKATGSNGSVTSAVTVTVAVDGTISWSAKNTQTASVANSPFVGYYLSINGTVLYDGYYGKTTTCDYKTFPRCGSSSLYTTKSSTLSSKTSSSSISVVLKVGCGSKYDGTYGNSGSYTLTRNTTTYYTVTFDVNGGTRTGGGALSQNIASGGSASVPTVTRDGYTFSGWSGTYTNVTSDRTITATWTKNAFSITYDDNGGAGGPGGQAINAGSSGTISTTVPTRTGYSFTGWTTSVNGSPVYQPGDTITPTGNMTLYAVWTPWIYTVTFSLNGGYGQVPSDIEISALEGGIIGNATPKSAERAFILWNTAADGSGDSYYAGDTYNTPQDGGTVTLYAMYCSTEIYINSDGSVECLEFIEEADCAFPRFESNGTIKAAEFIEHSEGVMFGRGILYANSFIEKDIILVSGKLPITTYSVTDSNNNILIDNNGYTIIGYK